MMPIQVGAAWGQVGGGSAGSGFADCRGTCQPTVDPNKQHSCNHTQDGRCLQIVDWLCRNDDDVNGRCATDVGLYRMLVVGCMLAQPSRLESRGLENGSGRDRPVLKLEVAAEEFAERRRLGPAEPETKHLAVQSLPKAPEPLQPLNSLNSSMRRRALAFHGASMAARKEELLDMHPDRLAIQQDILRARSVGRILAICTAEVLQGMDSINLVTALHRVAKLYDGSHMALVDNPRFELMLSAVSRKVDALNPRGMVHLVWSLASLQCWPDWSGDLIGRCAQCESFTGRDLSVLLGSLAKSKPPKHFKQCEQLQESLVRQLSERLPELTTSLDLACAAAALSRLQVRDEGLFVTIAQQAMPVLSEFSMSDVTSLLWAMAILNFTHGELCEQIRHLLRQKAESCSPKEITQIAWALSRLQEADEELLTETIAPVVRSKFLDFEAPRDLCTLAFAFSNARVFDEGIFNDFAHTLTSKVRVMNAHDVSSVVAAFAGIEYAHKGLFKALQKHAKAITASFTPLQIARTIHGFGTAGVDDTSLYRGLFGQVLQQRHLLHASNIVEILIGLAEAEYVPEGLEELLRDATRLVKWLDAAECIHALHALSRLQMDSTDLIPELMKTIRSRAQGWWRCNLQDMADLVEAMVGLKLDDSLLLNICAGQLPRLLSKTVDTPTFLRLWGAFAELRPHMRERVQERLQKNQRVRDGVAACLSAASEGIRAVRASNSECLTAARAAAQLLCACASLSWDQAPVPDVVQLMREMLGLEEVWQHGQDQHWWPPLAWALAELCYDDLARHVLLPCFRNSSLISMDATGKLYLAAAVVCLGYAEEFAGSKILLDVQLANEHDPCHTGRHMVLQSLELEMAIAGMDVLQGATLPHLEVKPSSLCSAGSLYDYADQVSNALVELAIAHEAKVLIGGCHYVQAVLFGQVALLIQSPRDLTISGSMLASARARTRQLTSLGWVCKEFYFSDIEQALQTSVGLKHLLAPLNAAKKVVKKFRSSLACDCAKRCRPHLLATPWMPDEIAGTRRQPWGTCLRRK
ncbi:hypothetical protein AK812_SmicGene10775 [Symbiodinium microadriaticum]|uniref:RNA-editing substrate-binding complex 6 protein domain-containing protein n=1 Tax=Symbiodinium microadriaticum TaxID=2951 RepID=A0A1Q9EF04_SYMMI|nr:hypothetical protein AK812_SmicGene10775 [Symbiodinium microadriaticum]